MDNQTAEYERIASGFAAPSLKPPIHYGDMTKVVFVHFIKSMNLCKSQKELRAMSEIYLRTPGFYDCLRDLFIGAEIGHIPYDVECSPFRSTIRNCITNDNSAKFWLIQSGLRFVNDILDKVIPKAEHYPVTAVNPDEDKTLPEWCQIDPKVGELSDTSDIEFDYDDSASTVYTDSIKTTSIKRNIQHCPHCAYVTSGRHLKRHIRAKHQ